MHAYGKRDPGGGLEMGNERTHFQQNAIIRLVLSKDIRCNFLPYVPDAMKVTNFVLVFQRDHGIILM